MIRKYTNTIRRQTHGTARKSHTTAIDYTFNSKFSSHFLIFFEIHNAKGLDTDQNRQNVCPDIVPSLLTLG